METSANPSSQQVLFYGLVALATHLQLGHEAIIKQYPDTPAAEISSKTLDSVTDAIHSLLGGN